MAQSSRKTIRCWELARLVLMPLTFVVVARNLEIINALVRKLPFTGWIWTKRDDIGNNLDTENEDIKYKLSGGMYLSLRLQKDF